MATWRLVYRSGGSAVFEADACRREGAHVVLRRYKFVGHGAAGTRSAAGAGADLERAERVD